MGWNQVRSLGRRFGAALLLTLGIAVGTLPSAQGQVVFSSIGNSYVTATVGVSGQPQNITPQINGAGRFGVFEAGTNGAPLMIMAANAISQSYVTVRIDGGPPVVGNDAATQTAPGWDLIFGDVGTNALNATVTNAKTDQGAWLQPPTAINATTLLAKWTTLPGGNATFPIPSIEIDLKMTLVHDMVYYQFTVINRDSQAHSIGLRFAQDYSPNAPVFTPTLAQIVNETDIVGNIPSFWFAQDSTRTTSVGATLTAPNILGNISTPERLTFGAAANVIGSLWTFTADPTLPIASGTNAASGVYFNTIQYGPGESHTVSTYFGKQRSTIDFASPWAAGVEAPFSLQYDSSKPVGQQITPNPFTVTAFVQNLSQLTLTNVTANISLPPGLALATGETATKTIGSLAVDGEATFSWQVVPTGLASGRQTFAVSFSAGPGTQGKVVTRDIDIPSLPTQNFSGGIQMVSFPYTFDDPTPEVALGINQANFALVRWNPTINTYEAVSRIVPGEGYWLNLSSSQTINLQGANPIPASTSRFEVKLKQSWNQIGNPFLYRVRWSDVQVVTTDVGDPNYLIPLSVSQAAQQGLILPTIYSYDTLAGEYKFDQDLSTELVPFQGYWVKALKPNLSLLFPPTSGRAARSNVTRAAGTTQVGGNNWSLRVVASNGTSQDGWNFLGVAPGASDTFDLKDVEKPPFIQDKVTVAFLRDTWGGRAGMYAQDMQAANGQRKTWKMVVTTPRPNQDVTLTWPDISTLPRGYELYVTDEATGQRKLMRQTLSLRYNTGDTTTRAFTITAEPRSGPSALVLTGHVRQTRGGSIIDVSSTQDVSLTFRVRTSSGQTVRTFSNSRAASLGTPATLLWDLRDNKGSAVAAGSFLVEVVGTTADGRSSKLVIPHIITR